MNKYFKETDIRQPIVLGSNLYKNPVCAEIGVLNGDHAEAIFCYLNPKKLYLIDPWINNEKSYKNTYDKFYFNEKTKIIKKTSLLASEELRHIKFDIIYIDANHAYDYVLQDLQLWFPLIKSKGMLSGHDWNKPDTGVQDAVKYFCKKNNLRYNISNNERNWWIIKI